MPTLKVSCEEYTRLVRSCVTMLDDYSHESTFNVLIELLHAKHDYHTNTFDVSKKLMQKIAIMNLCDMAIIQLRDSGGECDYANLGENSKSILLSIMYEVI